MNFTKATLTKRTRDLMDHHGLQDWDIRIGSARNMAGMCNYSRKQITMSLFLANARSRENTVDTILHEIAHALTPKDGGHGKEWKAMASAIGADPSRCFDSQEIDPEKRFRFIGFCMKHRDNVTKANRRSQRTCYCGEVIHWIDREDESAPAKPFYPAHVSKLSQALKSVGATIEGGDIIAPKNHVWNATEMHYLDGSSPFYTETDSGRERSENAKANAILRDVSQGVMLCSYNNCDWCDS